MFVHKSRRSIAGVLFAHNAVEELHSTEQLEEYYSRHTEAVNLISNCTKTKIKWEVPNAHFGVRAMISSQVRCRCYRHQHKLKVNNKRRAWYYSADIEEREQTGGFPNKKRSMFQGAR